ncbi:tRNA pseudouridine synthase-like 1 isoform X2 [Conger conger]|uniref:tRNA pseudouridine synthase-like 1 isoform X2 n=1 Tax=Conger conger TaxID=82655 RepID=UPI002A5B0237|nr:tRNA pseudouridine synthase-like 1 isoform X2 [Conger conger]
MENCRARYLIFFQYLGTKYSGVMKTPPHQPGLGVQNYLEKALQKLKPENEACVYISSRTDTGVHALCNSAHLDLQRRSGMPPFTGEVLAQALNFNLKPEPISVIGAYRVADTFHARFRASARTYTYRLLTGLSHQRQFPLVERDLCWALQNTELNIGAMQEAMSLLVGNHDFSTFRALNSDMPFKSPVKTLQHARLEPGPESFSQRHFNRNLQFWELTFKSPSFLYRQVRRMTGALVAVGQGRLSVSQLQELLEARDSLAYPQNTCAPPTGLFLTSVEYDESDLLFDT